MQINRCHLLDNMIRIHDSTTMKYKCQNEIIATDVNWCILDIAFSPASEYFVYSTWSSSCTLNQMHPHFLSESILTFLFLNFTVYYSGIHEKSHQLKPLPLNPLKSSFCVFSLAFSNCGEQIIGGGRYDEIRSSLYEFIFIYFNIFFVAMAACISMTWY